jgi:DNA helicase TIP49 (TBP-interacting protein)
VESVSEALFSEWKTELSQYSNQELRRASERRMNDTRKQYEGLVASMRRAEKKIDPVLTVFRDQVLFLKHNLNAQAISSLGGELGKVETDVAALIADLKKSIAEADAFIATMEKG